MPEMPDIDDARAIRLSHLVDQIELDRGVELRPGEDMTLLMDALDFANRLGVHVPEAPKMTGPPLAGGTEPRSRRWSKRRPRHDTDHPPDRRE